MNEYKRIFVIVLDSLGIGAMPDSHRFGDDGVDTFGHILETMGTLDIPNLKALGLLNLHRAGRMEGAERPRGRYMRLGEASNGKDTMTGHWEMMGIKTEKPFQTFTDTGFPSELISELERRCGKRVIGNKSASGTAIIEELGEEEINTGAMIVYTSADSVLQPYFRQDIQTPPLHSSAGCTRMLFRTLLHRHRSAGFLPMSPPAEAACGLHASKFLLRP